MKAPDVAHELGRISQVHRLVCFLWLSFVPVTVLADWVFGSRVASQVIVLLWIAAFLLCGLVVRNFPCPRCHKRFHYVSWKERRFRREVRDPWQTRPRTFLGRFLAHVLPQACLHCGLAIADRYTADREVVIDVQ